MVELRFFCFFVSNSSKSESLPMCVHISTYLTPVFVSFPGGQSGKNFRSGLNRTHECLCMLSQYAPSYWDHLLRWGEASGGRIQAGRLPQNPTHYSGREINSKMPKDFNRPSFRCLASSVQNNVSSYLPTTCCGFSCCYLPPLGRVTLEPWWMGIKGEIGLRKERAKEWRSFERIHDIRFSKCRNNSCDS